MAQISAKTRLKRRVRRERRLTLSEESLAREPISAGRVVNFMSAS